MFLVTSLESFSGGFLSVQAGMLRRKGMVVGWRWGYPLLMGKVDGCYGQALVWEDMVVVQVRQQLIGEGWPWMQRLSGAARFSERTMQFVHTGIFPGNLECLPLTPNPFTPHPSWWE